MTINFFINSRRTGRPIISALWLIAVSLAATGDFTHIIKRLELVFAAVQGVHARYCRAGTAKECAPLCNEGAALSREAHSIFMGEPITEATVLQAKLKSAKVPQPDLRAFMSSYGSVSSNRALK